MTDKNGGNGGKKGPNMTQAEDIEMGKAFVAASEDSIVGCSQKSADFKAKMLQCYNTLITKHNRLFHQNFPTRKNQNSLYNRFKVHSRLTLKMIGIEETMGEPPSSDSDRERFNQMIQDTWTKCNPDDARLCDTIWNLRIVLGKHPKWRRFQSDEDTSDEARKKKQEANKMRPEGTKKAKTAAADKKLIHDLVSTATDSKQKKQSSYVEKVTCSIDVMSKVLVDSIQAQNAHLKSQNDLKLMEGLSPTTKNAMSKRMAEVRMAEMQQQLDSYKKNNRPRSINITDQDLTSTLTEKDDTEKEEDLDSIIVEQRVDPFMTMLSEMSQSQPRNPDGCTMLMSTQEYERRCAYVPPNNTMDDK